MTEKTQMTDAEKIAAWDDFVLRRQAVYNHLLQITMNPPPDTDQVFSDYDYGVNNTYNYLNGGDFPYDLETGEAKTVIPDKDYPKGKE